MPGFDRRLGPLTIALPDAFARRTAPIEVVCRVSAGELKADSWYQVTDEGGWRIVSKGCHFVDLIQFICGCRPTCVFAERSAVATTLATFVAATTMTFGEAVELDSCRETAGLEMTPIGDQQGTDGQRDEHA